MADEISEKNDRRTFLCNLFMGTGLAVSHLLAGGFVLRFLYPDDNDRIVQMFVGLQAEMPAGSAKAFRTPRGQTINIVHGSDGFIALSDVCPHLGCKVHWESASKRFVCPCHNGHFDADGMPISGPPADAKTPLPRFDVVTDQTSVYIKVKVSS